MDNKILKWILYLLPLMFLLTNCVRPKIDMEQIQKIKSDFTKRELEYFAELAFKSDFNNKAVKLAKWDRDIRIGLAGDYSKEDSMEVIRIANELNDIINTIKIEIVPFESSNLKMHFVGYDEFDNFFKNASVGTHGFCIIMFDLMRNINRGTILINKSLSGKDRKSTILNEISNSLGLINDSYKYPTSAFQQFMNKNTTYNEIDKKVIDLLYNYDLPTRLDGKYFNHCFIEN